MRHTGKCPKVFYFVYTTAIYQSPQYSLKYQVIFYPFIVTFNVVEHPKVNSRPFKCQIIHTHTHQRKNTQIILLPRNQCQKTSGCQKIQTVETPSQVSQGSSLSACSCFCVTCVFRFVQSPPPFPVIGVYPDKICRLFCLLVYVIPSWIFLSLQSLVHPNSPIPQLSNPPTPVNSLFLVINAVCFPIQFILTI